METNTTSLSSLTPLLGVKQIASLLNVSPCTIYYWVEQREIPFLRVGRHLRFNAQDVIAFYAAKSSAQQPACRYTLPSIQDPRPLRSFPIRHADSAPAEE